VVSRGRGVTAAPALLNQTCCVDVDRHQDRHPREEVLELGRQRAHHLLGEELVEVAARRVDVRHEHARIGRLAILETGPHECQEGWPAVGPLVELRDDVLVERPAVRLPEEA
jgi:hypothetical protein